MTYCVGQSVFLHMDMHLRWFIAWVIFNRIIINLDKFDYNLLIHSVIKSSSWRVRNDVIIVALEKFIDWMAPINKLIGDKTFEYCSIFSPIVLQYNRSSSMQNAMHRNLTTLKCHKMLYKSQFISNVHAWTIMSYALGGCDSGWVNALISMNILNHT